MSKLKYFVLLVALLSACNNQPSGDRPILIKFPHVTSPATPKGQTAERFRQLVEDRLDGKVIVEVYPSSQLMNDDDSLDALAFGEIHMIAVSLSKFDRLTRKFQLFDLPFLFNDLTAVEQFQATAQGQKLLDATSKQGIKGLAFWHNGMKQFGGPVPMRTPADAQGLKFRIMESDVLQEQINTIGGNPQKMAFGEVYQALQTGAVDAQENTWSNMYSSKFYEVQNYLTHSNHGYLGYLVATNTDFWEGLPPEVRDELAKILREVTVWGNEQASQINQLSMRKIADSGISRIVELSEEEKALWQATMSSVWQKFEDQIGSENIKFAQQSGTL